MRRRNWAVLVLTPLLLSGCGALGLSSPSGAAGVTTQASGPSWINVQQGSAAPSPVPSHPAATPTPSATGGFLPLGAPAPVRTPVSTCSPNTFNFSKVAIAYVIPSTTSAVVSWYNVGGYNLKAFRLTAISQTLHGGAQRNVGFRTIPPPKQCGQMSATITGLDRKTSYVFAVDAVVLRPTGDGTHEATVARSRVTYTR